jgi:hypothetical protein
MAKNGPNNGSDAAYIAPKFVPNEQLLGRDDSGGQDFQPYTAQFGDGGVVTGGAKSYFSASGGGNAGEPLDGDEISQKGRDTTGGINDRRSPTAKPPMGRKKGNE